MEATKMENIVKIIVKKYGSYREKEIMRHSHTIERAGTWNAEHKVLNVLDAVPDADGYHPGFQVDIVTMSICG